MKFVLNVELEDERYCDGCDALDRGVDICRALQEGLHKTLIGIDEHGYREWRRLRLHDCPLRKTEVDGE